MCTRTMFRNLAVLSLLFAGLASVPPPASWASASPDRVGLPQSAFADVAAARIQLRDKTGVFPVGEASASDTAESNVWTSIGPAGGSIFTLAIDPATPTTLYAGSSGGVFKSTNGGGNWVNTGLTATYISSLAINLVTPTILYAGTGSGVFTSTNGGETWGAVNTSMTSFRSLVIDSVTPTILYGGIYISGVFKSIDGGVTWFPVNTGLSNRDVLTLAIDPKTPTTLYAGIEGGGVVKSTNGGESWYQAGLGSSNVQTLAIDPVTPTTLYAGPNSSGVYKSTDGGETWSAVNTGLTTPNVFALAIDPKTPTILYAGTYGGGVFQSTDGGENWSAVNTGLINLIVRALAINPATPTTLYAGTNGGGVFRMAAPAVAYVANGGSNTISVIDTSTGSVATTIPGGNYPCGVAVNPAGTRVYVTNQYSNTVSVIDTSTNSVVATVTVGSQPCGVAINPAGTLVYVANTSSQTVSVIDTSTNTVTVTIAEGEFPQGVAANPDGKYVYVTNGGSSTVGVIDTSTYSVVAYVSVGSNPIGVAVNSAGTRVYVTNHSSQTVSVIDTSTNSVVATVTVGTQPGGVVVNPAGTRAYVANYASNTVSVIDTITNSVVATIPVGIAPRGVAINPIGTHVYVTNQGSGTVSVIDTSTNSVVVTVTVGSQPGGVAIGPVAKLLTVIKTGNGTGAVTSNPAGINCGTDCTEGYALNTSVMLTATAATDSTFAGWSGACSGTGTCQVTMSRARSVTATFNIPLTGVVISGPTMGVIDATYTFTANVSPVTATLPITYTWSPAPNSVQGAANATYSWPTTGTQTITVTATNAINSVTATRSITIALATTRICVMRDVSGTLPVTNSLVYVNSVKPPGVTGEDGCINRVGLAEGDRVFAMVTSTHTLTEAISRTKYGIYATSLLLQLKNVDKNISDGKMQPFSIEDPTAPVTLTIYATNTLTMFDLNVAVEWNATRAELETLAAKLITATAKFYNATDGQMMLRDIRIYTDTAHWTSADLRVVASRDMVANSIAYGVISSPITLTWPLTSTMLAYWGEDSLPFIPGYIIIPRPQTYDSDDVDVDVYAIMQEFVHHYLGSLDEHLGWIFKNGKPRFGPVTPCVIRIPSWNAEYASLAAILAPEGSQYDFVWGPQCEKGANYMLQGGGLWDTWKILYPHLITPGDRKTAVLGPLTLPLTPTVEAPPGDDPLTQTVHFILDQPSDLEEFGLYLLHDDRVIALSHIINLSGNEMDEFVLPGQQAEDQLVAWARGEYDDGDPVFYGATQTIPAEPSFTVTLRTQPFKTVKLQLGSVSLTATAYLTGPLGTAPITASLYRLGTGWVTSTLAMAGSSGGRPYYSATLPLADDFDFGYVVFSTPYQTQSLVRIEPIALFRWLASMRWIAPESSDGILKMYDLQYLESAEPVRFMIAPANNLTNTPPLYQVVHAYEIQSNIPVTFTKGTILFNFDPSRVTGAVTLYYRPVGQSTWQALEASVDHENGVATAQLVEPGTYVLLEQYRLYLPIVLK
jgi:YVTN family beta-propeller protein